MFVRIETVRKTLGAMLSAALTNDIIDSLEDQAHEEKILTQAITFQGYAEDLLTLQESNIDEFYAEIKRALDCDCIDGCQYQLLCAMADRLHGGQ